MRLDFILVPEVFDIEQYNVLGDITGSDHRPIHATVVKRNHCDNKHVALDFNARVSPLLPPSMPIEDAVTTFMVFAALFSYAVETAVDDCVAMAEVEARSDPDQRTATDKEAQSGPNQLTAAEEEVLGTDTRDLLLSSAMDTNNLDNGADKHPEE